MQRIMQKSLGALLACWMLCAGWTGVRVRLNAPVPVVWTQAQATAQNNGTLVGSPGFVASPLSGFGQALSLDGANRYVSLPPGMVISTAGASWTAECVVTPLSSSGVQVYQSNAASAGGAGTWWYGDNAGALNVSIAGFNAAANFATATLTVGTTYRLRLVMQNGTTATMYVNGASVGTQTGTYATPASPKAAIGALWNATDYNYPATAVIDEAAFWNTALNAGAYTPAAAPYAGSAANLVALYHLDSNANDSKVTTTPSLASASPTTLYASRTTTVTLTGLNTHWSTSAPAATVQNTTTTATAGAVTVVDDTHLTVPITTNGVAGTFTLTATNGTDGALVSPSLTDYTLVYDKVLTTDPLYGQNIMVLVPNPNSAHPYNSATPTKLILYFHGYGEYCTGMLDEAVKGPCVVALLNAGYILGGTDASSTSNWGNQASVDSYVGLWRYCTTNYNIVGTGFWMQSMGGLCGLLSLAENNIAGVVGCLGTYPVVSLATMHTAGASSSNFLASIEAAYGVTGSGTATYANMTTGHDPGLKWAWAFRPKLPFRLYASYADLVVPRAQNTDALAATLSGSTSVTVITCSGNHGDPSHFVPPEYVTFFDGCFASPPPTSGGMTTTILRPIGGNPVHKH